MPITNGQASNNGGGGGSTDAGATSIEVTSPDSSVTQVGQSSYNPTTKKLSVALQAAGGGGVPTNTKYDFIVTGDNTPTFAAGEEYILYPTAIGEYVEFELTLNANYKSGATVYGSITAKFSILRDGKVGYSVAAIDLLSLNQSSSTAQNLTNLFTFTAYLTTAPYPINGITIPTGSAVITIKLNNALTYAGATNSVFAKVTGNSVSAYNGMMGIYAPAVLGIVSTPITALTGEEVGATQAIPQDVALFQSTMASYNFMTNTTTGLTQLKPYYSKYKFVDPVNGTNATTSGNINAPYLTMAYALAQNLTTGLIFVLMGQSAEAAFSIPAASTNIDMIALGTRSALNGFTNKVTVLGTGAGSVRFQGINFGGGLTRDVTSNCGIYVYNGSVGTVGFSQLGNGYTELNGADASNGANTLSAGTIIFYGGKAIAPVITGTGTTVTLDNVGTVIGNATMAAGGTLYAFETNFIALATGHAITSSAGTVTTMQGCNFIRPNGTLASISVSNYDIQNTDFDKANSVLGSHIGNYDWYSRLGLLNADTITTATKMLVRKATGEIAEQLIPTFNIPIQFNAPVRSLYSPDLTPTPLLLRSSAGSSQTIQMVQLCTVPGSITLDQLFNATIASGKTLTYTGRLVVYNALPATKANYYIIIQMLGVVGSTGQLVNLGDAVTTQLSKVQYAYTPVNISGSYTNPSGTAIEAIGIRAQLLYGEANGTALVDTFFLQGTIT